MITTTLPFQDAVTVKRRRFSLAEISGGSSLFLIGVGMVFTVRAIGALPVAELVSLAWAGWLVGRRVKEGYWAHTLLGSPAFRWLGWGLMFSFGGYLVSDLVRGSAAIDLLRGWARLGFLGIDILAITYLLARDWMLLRWLVAGFIVGVVVSVLTVGPHADDYWKFGFAYPISFLLPMVVPARRTWMLCGLFAGLGALHLSLGARSLGAICWLAAALLWLPRAGRRIRKIAGFISVGVALFAIRHFYVETGAGERAVGSTTERAAMLAFAANSFKESPLIGQGSWFTKGHRVEAFFARRADYRNEIDRVDLEADEEMVIHSQILAALAEGGLLGGTFFLVLGGLLMWSIGFTATHDFTLRPLVLVLLLNASWDLFMSPFSGSERVFIALSCALVVALRALPSRPHNRHP